MFLKFHRSEVSRRCNQSSVRYSSSMIRRIKGFVSKSDSQRADVITLQSVSQAYNFTMETLILSFSRVCNTFFNRGHKSLNKKKRVSFFLFKFVGNLSFLIIKYLLNRFEINFKKMNEYIKSLRHNEAPIFPPFP